MNEIEAAYKLSSTEAILNQIQNLVLKAQKDEIVNSDDNKQQEAMDKIDRISEILAGKQGEETGKYVILKTKEGYIGSNIEAELVPVDSKSDAIIFEREISSAKKKYTQYKVHKIVKYYEKYLGWYISYKSIKWNAILYEGKDDGICLEYSGYLGKRLICRGLESKASSNKPQVLSIKDGKYFWYNDYDQCETQMFYVKEQQ